MPNVMFGYRLRSLRQKKGWTLRQAASAANLTLSFIWYLEQGESNPSATTLCKLADAYGVTIDSLLRTLPNE